MAVAPPQSGHGDDPERERKQPESHRGSCGYAGCADPVRRVAWSAGGMVLCGNDEGAVALIPRGTTRNGVGVQRPNGTRDKERRKKGQIF